MGDRNAKQKIFGREEALFLLRPELYETDLIREHGSTMHGVVLQESQLVRLPGDSPDTDLGRAARETKVPHVHDPATDVLAWHTGKGDKRFGRAGAMPCASVVDLPIDPSLLLADESLLEEFVRATISTQGAASHPSPPYFRFDAFDDPWLELSVRAAAVAHRLSGNRQPAVFVYATLDCLRSGALAMVADHYRQALPKGALIFLSVGGLHSEDSEPEELATYIGAIDAFRSAGFEVISDRVARFGAATVAAGARGYCSGTRVFRHRAASPESTEIHRRGAQMRYEDPGRKDRIARKDVARRLEKGSITACPFPDCPVGTEKAFTVKDLRLHALHLHLLEVGEAQESGEEIWAELLAGSPRNFVRGWAEALRLIAQAREAA